MFEHVPKHVTFKELNTYSIVKDGWRALVEAAYTYGFKYEPNELKFEWKNKTLGVLVLSQIEKNYNEDRVTVAVALKSDSAHLLTLSPLPIDENGFFSFTIFAESLSNFIKELNPNLK